MPRVRAGLREPSRKRLRASGTRERTPRALDGREANRLSGFSVILLFVEALLRATSQTEPLLLGRCPRGPRHRALSPEPPTRPPVFCLPLSSRGSGPADQTSLLTALFCSKFASLLPSVDTPLSQAIADQAVSFPTPSPLQGSSAEHACPRASAVPLSLHSHSKEGSWPGSPPPPPGLSSSGMFSGPLPCHCPRHPHSTFACCVMLMRVWFLAVTQHVDRE